jgi:hypothetical protein
MSHPGFMDAVKNPITNSLYVDDLFYQAAPTPPGSEERITQDGIIRDAQDGEIRVTE